MYTNSIGSGVVIDPVEEPETTAISAEFEQAPASRGSVCYRIRPRG
jgi:hypothetical protein